MNTIKGHNPPPVAKSERPKPTPAPPGIRMMFPGFFVLTRAMVDDMCLDENGETAATRHIKARFERILG